jgi:arylsulfatase A-like enzyme
MITPGSENDDLICLVDFFATCASIIDKPLPKNGAEDSFDYLKSLLEDGSNKGTRDTLIHHSGGGMFSIRKGPWKFIEGLGSGGFSRPRSKKALPFQAKTQLYNMENDQQEQNNLWKSRRDLVRDLKKELYDAVNYTRRERRGFAESVTSRP